MHLIAWNNNKKKKCDPDRQMGRQASIDLTFLEHETDGITKFHAFCKHKSYFINIDIFRNSAA